MRKPDFHRENPEQRISIVLGGVVLSIVELSVEHQKIVEHRFWRKFTEL